MLSRWRADMGPANMLTRYDGEVEFVCCAGMLAGPRVPKQVGRFVLAAALSRLQIYVGT